MLFNQIETTPSLDIEFVIYIAGFFDGEGWICPRINKQSKRGTGVLAAGIGQADRKVLLKCKETFGGWVGQPHKYDGRNYAYSIWEITNDKAVEFLKTIYPYLRLKKRQAALAFKFRKIMTQNLRSKDEHRITKLTDLIAEIRQDRVERYQNQDLETVKEVSSFEENDPVQFSLPF